MADVSNELIDEVLKAMQARLANIDDKLTTIDGRIASLGLQLSAVRTDNEASHQDISTIYKTLTVMDGRLIRIEKRLDLVDEPAE